MFGFLSSRRCRRPSQQPKRHRRIQFESLERRYCLSAPSITSMQIDAVEDTTVSVSGYVTDESPETVQVEFYDILSGSTSPDASGYFTYTGEASWLGTIVAYALDEEVLQSEPAEVDLTSDEPTINSLALDYGYHTAITITGQVIDEDPDGLTVYISGAANGTAITDANGNFTLQVADGFASMGELEVSVEDVWGQPGSDWTLITGDNSPQIVDFSTHVGGSGLLTVRGTVTDEDPVGLTVVINFWGNDYEVTTDSDGDFIWQLQLEEGQEDFLTVVAFDWWGLESEASEAYVAYDLGSY